MQFGRSIALLLGAGALALTSACSSSSPDSGKGDGAPSKTAASGAASAGLGAAELQERWWNWAGTAPGSANPIDDEDGHLCGDRQASDVWFLAGTHGGPATRTCKLPSGTPVAFPLVNRIATKSDCETFMTSAKGSATLDGKAVEPQRLDATPIKDNGPGAMACGLWVRLGPLSPGEHTLSFEGSSGTFSTSVDYRLEAGGR
ncbi:signal protein [Streptomyces sp. HU2014]|uniref:signal protein n=1 Tax=Streptomyces sp. HU2014 TaxID=2939414 RepID=UPI00200EFB14|nr:signal protein [Streptomyces sp. HU2014]UQI46255.1 signal protein [Streptomyces sp. HU2014]